MNYIARLQAELAAAEATLGAKAEAIQEFRVHLAGDKFAGTETDGSRKDWIATSDVNAWLERCEAIDRIVLLNLPPRDWRGDYFGRVPPEEAADVALDELASIAGIQPP